MADEPQLPALVTEPVTSPLPADFDTDDAYVVAREVAMSLGTIPVICAKHGLSEAQYTTLSKDPFYIEALERATDEWRTIKSTMQRVVLKSAHAMEESLLMIAARLQDKAEPLTSVAQMTKVLADVTGLGKQQQQNAPQERVTISIDFGADSKLVVEKTIEGRALPADGEGQSEALTVQPQPEGVRPATLLPLIPEGTGN